jgi:hypothetical protein
VLGGGQGQPFFVAVDYLRDRQADAPDVPWRIRRAIDLSSQRGVDWWVWRLVTDSRLHASYAEVRDRWTFADTLAAHLVLDTLDAAKPE